MKIDSVRIRAGVVGDVDAISVLARETFSESFGHLYKDNDLKSFLDENHTPSAYRSLFENPRFRVWLAEDEQSALVGYITALPCDLPLPNLPENSGEIQRFYIRKSHHGRGLGSRMLAIAIAWLEENFGRLYVSVYEGNSGAQKLYERYGFRRVHRYLYLVGEQADPEWIMERTDPPQ